MKKILKLSLALLLCVVLAFSFCSCVDVDELRNNQGFWANKERTVISFRGAEYKLLPACDEIYVVPSAEWYDPIYITEKDVPVLLAADKGMVAQIGKGAELLVCGIWESDTDKVYCRTDLYDQKVKAIESFKLEHYCAWGPSYEENNGKQGALINQYRLLSEQSSAVVSEALATEGVVRNNFSFDGYEIFLCDKNIEFIADGYSGGMWVTAENNAYYLVKRVYDREKFDTTFTYYQLDPQKALALMVEIKAFEY